MPQRLVHTGQHAEIFVDPSFVVAELPGDPIWTPFAAQSVAAAPNVVDLSSSATSSASQDELSWLFGAGRFMPATSSSPTNEGGPIAPEYGALLYGLRRESPAEWDIGQVSWPTPAAPATSAPVLALGKRRREESQGVGATNDNYHVPPQKRGRGEPANGILEATQSAVSARHKPVARTPNKSINDELKEAGRGAERLAAPNAQGVHHRPLQRPSFQQGSVEEEPVQQQQQEQGQQAEAVKYLEFPKKFGS
ncbi:hypothetical protein BJV77DRAFT_1161362 [Russula vinacea]|nr:hypothetical protein BJV77DRAFT_1161362 [Russula vinacea]